jgi:hypothetical protein
MHSILPFLIALPLSIYLLYLGAKAQPTRQELVWLFGSGFLIGVTGMYWLVPEMSLTQISIDVITGMIGGVIMMLRIPLDVRYSESRKTQASQNEQSKL